MVDRFSVAGVRPITTAALYVVAYVALDWLSFIHPLLPLAVTPWNPPPGLSLFLLLRFGLRYAPALFVATYLGDLLVRGAAPFDPLTLAGSVVLASGYAGAGAVLAGPLAVGRRLQHVRDVSCLVAAAGVAPLVIALAYVGLNVWLGSLSAAQATDAALQFWIGDAIGIVVTTPFLLEFADRRPTWPLQLNAEAALQMAAVLLALWIVFGLAATDEFKFFYLLFLPLIWIAMRRGMRGAVVASLAMQLGLVLASESIAAKGILFRELQFLMLTLALTALYLGMAVTERIEAQRAAAARDAGLNRALRMATAGELAATIAHELNQPLAAIGAYARSSALLLDDARGGPLLRETLDKITREVARAGNVVRRLRDFYRSGSTQRVRVALEAVVDAAIESLAPRLAQHRIEVDVERTPGLPAVTVDRVQIQMVLHNLLANALESLAASDVARRIIHVRLQVSPRGMLGCEIADNGPGVPADVAPRLFEPFTSTKADGMGLGLAMSRSIVEAHGGTLALARSAEGGASFELHLPLADDHGSDDHT